MKVGSKFREILKLWWTLPLLFALLMCYSTKWVLDTYDSPSFEQILFHISEPVTGVESELISGFFKQCVLLSVIESIIISIAICMFIKMIKNDKIVTYIKSSLAILCVVIIGICLNMLGFFEYLAIGNQESTFIKDNYEDPRNVKITFREKKRNLIYIFAESLESSFLSIEEGGLQEINLMPELTSLAKNNLSFSDTEKIGGAHQLRGTDWTSAAMVAHTAGIPLKMGRAIINYHELPQFLAGAYTLGDILFSHNYNQTIMFGSGAEFGNRGTYFKTHGFYRVSDYYTAINEGKIPEDYLVWWGYEDSKLFQYAKEEALKLSKEEEPFNLSILTVNTHHIDGYLEDSCPKIYDSQYENVIACSSYQINEFINWCMEQDFYENTTIIISGDHLTMKTGFFDDSVENNRRIFNTFINSAVDPVNSTNREFSTLDMFPTTLAAIGATIDGDRLGLGTNLFSSEQTLIEKYGVEKVDEELSYKSEFYNRELLHTDD